MIEGDNEYVCGLLNGNYMPAEMFFYNCMEVSRDFLNGKQFSSKWIPRELNSICDGLAKLAVERNDYSLNCDPGCLVDFASLTAVI